MKILVTAAEVAPYAKVGGLADMTAALPKAWSAAGHDVIVLLPLYGTIDTAAYGLVKTEHVIGVPFGGWTEYAALWKGTLPDSEVPVYFLDSHEYYGRQGIYGYHEGFQDNDRRFMFLCRATFEVAKALEFKPDVIHAHDYHTAMCMPMLHVHYKADPHFAGTAGVFTIHNMAYQGMFDPQRVLEFAEFGMKEFYPGSWFEHDSIVNAMKAGILFADKVTTVSPTYAQEIRWTPEGMGLQGALQARGGDLIGVLNGIDNTEWCPSIDKYLTVPYDHATIEKKEINKQALLTEFGIDVNDSSRDLPLVGMVTRLTEQKGISILQDALEPFIANGQIRLVMLGSGEKRFEDYFRHLAAQYPQRVLLGVGYNNALSHRIQGASDFYLMPSKFEPCGLTQMFALAYGAIPIVRATGGLADTVEHYDPVTFTGNGIRFNRYTSDDCRAAINEALRLYKREPHWSHLRANAMKVDHSARRSAEQYIEVFTWAKELRAKH